MSLLLSTSSMVNTTGIGQDLQKSVIAKDKSSKDITAEPAEDELVLDVTEENADAEQPVEEVVLVEEGTNVDSKYKTLLLTEEITYGSRLAWISKKYYGHQRYWPYLYDANRDRITNPSLVPVGTPIRVPKLTAAQKDTTSAAFIQLKQEAVAAIR